MAQEEAEQRPGMRVAAVHLQVGRLAGVVKEALQSSYELACEGTELEGCRLVIEDLPVVVQCPQCRAPRTLPSVQCFLCPQCQTPVSDVIQGRELQVVALEIEAQATHALEVQG